ncbi:MAG: helix-turn-helix transcriptional regulator [Pseudomonadota bacterium]
MNVATELPPLSLRVYDVVAQPSLLPIVLEDIATGLGADAAGIADIDLSNSSPRAFVGTHNIRDLYERDDRDCARSADRPLYKALAENLGSYEFSSDIELLDRYNQAGNSPVNLDEFRSVLRDNYDLHHRVLSALSSGDQSYNCISLMFTSGSADRRRMAVKAGNQLLPHIQKAMSIAQPLTALEARYRSVLDVLDRLRLGVIITGLDRDVWLTNEAARRILERRDALRIDANGKLVATNGDSKRTLTNAFQNLGSVGPADDITQRMCLDRDRPVRAVASKARKPVPGMKEPYVADCSLVHHADLANGRAGLGVLTLLSDPDSTSRVDLGALTQVYGLTRSERAVCELLLDGHSNAEIADIRNVTADTVASQIKSLFNKTACKRRAEVVHMAYRVSLPICR